MSNKILLAVNETFCHQRDELLPPNYIVLNGKGIIEQAKADAEQIVKDKCIALIDEILAKQCDEDEVRFENVSPYVSVSDIEAIKEKL